MQEYDLRQVDNRPYFPLAARGAPDVKTEPICALYTPRVKASDRTMTIFLGGGFASGMERLRGLLSQ